MWVVRAVQLNDLDPLLELTRMATQGLTSLQLDRHQLLHRVEQSVFAFSRTSPSPAGEPYMLVMANRETGELVGTSTVFAKTGGYQPFYTYQLVSSEHHSEQLAVRQRRVRLELLRIHDGPTEIGSLFLRRAHRGSGRGRWLSLARFAVIAMRPSRFADRVIAEMRGKAEPDGTVPFWEAVAGRFIPTDFATADTLSTVSKQFIEELIPAEPIYLNLLPNEVCEQLGQVHPETAPAVRLLEAEGFRRTDQVDIFDGGPVLSCNTTDIDAVRRTTPTVVRKILDRPQPEAADTVVASTHEGFTSVLAAPLRHDDGISLSRVEAEQLGLDVGSTCHCLPLRRPT